MARADHLLNTDLTENNRKTKEEVNRRCVYFSLFLPQSLEWFCKAEDSTVCFERTLLAADRGAPFRSAGAFFFPPLNPY